MIFLPDFRKINILSVFLFSILFSLSILGQENRKKDSLVLKIQQIKDEATNLTDVKNAFTAIAKLEEALALYQENTITNNTLLFGLYVDLSFLYAIESVRNEERSLYFADKAKEIAKTKDINAYDLINFYISLANIEHEEHNVEEALGYITKGFNILTEKDKEISKEVGEKSKIKLTANLLEWFVSLNFSLKKEGTLIKAHQKIEAFFYKHKNISDVKYYFGLASFRVGRFYQTNNVNKASLYFNKAAKNGDENVKLYANICMGFAFLNAKKYDEVPAIIRKLEQFKDLNRFQKLNIHEIAAWCYADTNQKLKLIEHTNKALLLLNANEKIVDVLHFKPEDFSPIKQLKYPVLLNQFALFLEQTKDAKLVATAGALFKIALQQFDDRIDTQQISKLQANYEIIKNRNLNFLIKNVASIDEKKKIIAQIERIENKTSLNKLVQNRSLADNKTELDNLLKEEHSLREEITDLKQKQIANDTLFEQALFELDLKLKTINEKIINENPTVYSLNSEGFTFDNFKLLDGTNIIKFVKAEEELFRIVISDTYIAIRKIGMYKNVQEKITSFLTGIKNTVKDINEGLSQELYNNLLGDLKITPNTIFINDDGLRNFPFELLRNQGKYLIAQTAISYAAGLSYLNSTIYGNKTFDYNAVFFAPSYRKFVPSEKELAIRGAAYDLKGAREEVATLYDLVGGLVFEDEKASKSQFFDLSNNTAVLHLAGHAFLNDKDPELSNIVFSDNEENNRVYISELYGFKSNAELAVLSACNTGVGGFDNGKGLTSLSEAFMYSGIPSTLSSLWSAPDQSTKKIMISFYSYLSDGLSKSKALQNAKLDYLKTVSSEKLSHPYYWAGFVLYGKNTPLQLNTFNGSIYYWIFGVLLLLTILFFTVRFRKKLKI